ncbi:MAG: cysteine-rich CWC family protein [Burkholderiales bacterium]|nr:cysteine-rich CWC family protein [Burkholderiales bacterium]
MSPTPSQDHDAASATTVDATRCPLCGGANNCAVVAADGQPAECWCRSLTFTTELLAQVPAAQRGRACICAGCAAQAAQAAGLDG